MMIYILYRYTVVNLGMYSILHKCYLRMWPWGELENTVPSIMIRHDAQREAATH